MRRRRGLALHVRLGGHVLTRRMSGALLRVVNGSVNTVDAVHYPDCRLELIDSAHIWFGWSKIVD